MRKIKVKAFLDRKFKRFISIAIIAITTGSAFAISANSYADIPNQQRQQELIHLLKQDCGSCHGMTMKGGLGPALLPENLINKPNHVLVGVIKYGRETLAMPAWDGILNTVEIEWLVAQLKEGID
ncbi:MAG: cytochrome c55X [Oleispira sp.]|jgi:cytochrome c55X